MYTHRNFKSKKELKEAVAKGEKVTMAIKAVSYERYNGGVKVKRLHGSSTVTYFYVYDEKDSNDPSKWLKVETKGPTPGERMSIAKDFFRKHLPESHLQSIGEGTSFAKLVR